MPLSYSTVEQRILDASVTLQAQNPPLIAQTAREFNVPYQRLLARYHGRQSKQTRPGAGRKLDPAQELAVCHYLDHLDRMGTSARYSMLAQCANSILNAATTIPLHQHQPLVECGQTASLRPIQNSRCASSNLSILLVRTRTIPRLYTHGSVVIRSCVRSMELTSVIATISMRLNFVLVWLISVDYHTRY